MRCHLLLIARKNNKNQRNRPRKAKMPRPCETGRPSRYRIHHGLPRTRSPIFLLFSTKLIVPLPHALRPLDERNPIRTLRIRIYLKRGRVAQEQVNAYPLSIRTPGNAGIVREIGGRSCNVRGLGARKTKGSLRQRWAVHG